MDDWQYLSLEDLEQNEVFPKGKSSAFLVPWRLIMSRDQKSKMKEIGLLVANLLCSDKQIGISEWCFPS